VIGIEAKIGRYVGGMPDLNAYATASEITVSPAILRGTETKGDRYQNRALRMRH
jgi:hypothetical protein